MTKISLAGHLCVDLIPELPSGARLDPGRLIEVGRLSFSLGGCVANTARVLSALGHPVTAYAGVGPDELGAFVREQLNSEFIDARISVHDAATSYSLVIEPAGSDRTFWHHAGTNALLDGSAIDLAGCDLLHLGYPSLLTGLVGNHGAALTDLLARARQAGVTTSVDLAVVDPASPEGPSDWSATLQRIVGETDIITPSLDDLTSALAIDEPTEPHLAEGLADMLISWGAAVAVVSDGASGLVLRTSDADRLSRAGRALSEHADAWADKTLRMPALPVTNIVTTNGAGDASTAGILFALSHGWAPDEALRIATACSAAVLRGQTPTAESIGVPT